MKNKWLAFGSVSAFVLLSATSALSLTGEEVLDKMNSDESTGYMIGVVHALAYVEQKSGNRERSSCILEWSSKDGGMRQIMAMLERMKDAQAIPIIDRLAERACEE